MDNAVHEIKDTLKQQTWLDKYAVPIQQTIMQAYQKAGKLGLTIRDFLNGTWLGHPLHPVLTDLPIGAWTVGIFLDAVEKGKGRRRIQQGADTAIAIGAVSAVSAAAAGLTDWQFTRGETRRTGLLHASINTLGLSLFIGSLVTRKTGNRALGRSLALAGYTVVSLGAYLGGDLVFRQKMGVNHAPEGVEIPAFEAVLNVDELSENQLTRAQWQDIPLVLLRKGDQVYALAETCAHMGGPLAKGKLSEDEEGNPTVICPWHSSTYDMTSGYVLHGPSAYPQPCFEARIRDGKVEVRHRLEA